MHTLNSFFFCVDICVDIWYFNLYFKESLENLNSLIKEKEQLIAENNVLSKKYNELNDSIAERSTWNKEKEKELLGNNSTFSLLVLNLLAV